MINGLCLNHLHYLRGIASFCCASAVSFSTTVLLVIMRRKNCAVHIVALRGAEGRSPPHSNVSLPLAFRTICNHASVQTAMYNGPEICRLVKLRHDVTRNELFVLRPSSMRFVSMGTRWCQLRLRQRPVNWFGSTMDRLICQVKPKTSRKAVVRDPSV
jgi:hypothetical protein